MLQIIIFMIFVTIFLLLATLGGAFGRRSGDINRLAGYLNVPGKDDKSSEQKKDHKYGLEIVSRQISGVKFLGNYRKKVQFRLVRAHFLLKADEFIAICLIVSIFLGFLVYIFSLNFLFAIAGGILGWVIPSFVLNSKIKTRKKILNDQLNDTIIMISNSLKAGFSFFQAIDAVTKEMTGPVAEEFSQLQREINLGMTTEQALENIVSRADSDDMEMIVTAVLIQRQVGGNLSEILDNISSTIRERVKLKGEMKTMTAQGKMSGIIIGGLPVVMGLLLYLINPSYMAALFTEKLGIVIIAFSILMELTGIFIISKIIKVEM